MPAVEAMLATLASKVVTLRREIDAMLRRRVSPSVPIYIDRKRTFRNTTPELVRFFAALR